MDDDLGVPAALAVVHDTVRDGNTALAAGDRDTALRAARRRGAGDDRRARPRPARPAVGQRRRRDDAGRDALDALVERLLEQRQARARRARTSRAADAIRDRAHRRPASSVEDTPDGPRWTICKDDSDTWPATPSARRDRASGTKKGAVVGSGGQRARALRARARPRRPRCARGTRRRAGPRGRQAPRSGAGRAGRPRRSARDDDARRLLVGRNPVVEALRAGVPATALYVALGIERRRAGHRGGAARRPTAASPMLEVSRAELDRLTGGVLHQGIALQVPPYRVRAPGRPAGGRARLGPRRRCSSRWTG